MKTAQDVLRKHDESPGAAAVELVRRLARRGELKAVALAWCDHFGSKEPFIDIESGVGRGDRGASAYQLLSTAVANITPLEELVKRGAHSADHAPTQTNYDTQFLSAMLALWPHRDTVVAWAETLEKWTNGELKRRAALARELYDFPDIAYSLLGSWNAALTRPECGRCGEQCRAPGSRGIWHLDVLLRRRERGCVSDPRDEQLMAAFPIAMFVGDMSFFCRMREWLVAGNPAPERWVAGIEKALVGKHWINAAVLLCAVPCRHTQVIKRIAAWVKVGAPARDVLTELVTHAGHGVLCRQLFIGKGWGRKGRPRKLLPISRALLDVGMWPTETWHTCLLARHAGKPDAERDEGREDERAYEHQREVLAEALLDRALDPSRDVAVRHTALSALEGLEPKGDGSWIRALSKIKAPPKLALRARAVQARLSKTRAGHLGAEFGIADACECLFDGPMKKG